MIFPTMVLLATLATIQAAAPTTCPAVDSQTSVYIPDEDCTKFWQCSNGTPYLFDCPAGLHFNPTLNVCDWPDRAGCGGKAPDTPTTSSAAPKPTTAAPTTAAPTKAPTATPTKAPTAPPSNGEGSCENLSNKCPVVDGPNSVYIPLRDCTKFCQCSNGVAIQHDCPVGLEFNPIINVCDWPDRAGCGGNAPETPTTSSAAPKPTPSAPTTAAPTKAPTATPTKAPTVPPSNGEGSCQKLSNKCPAVDGPNSVYIPLRDCTKFCQCSNGVAIQQLCPVGLEFNPIKNVCDWPKDAGCKK